MPKMVENFARDVAPADMHGRLDAPAFHRNKDPLVATLKSLLESCEGDIIEIGSGTGQHAVTFAAALEGLTFWPSDPLPEHIASIEAWRAFSDLPNVKPATQLDCLQPVWRIDSHELASESLTGVIAINVIHIAPRPVAEAIFAGAGKCLNSDGLLIFYGPFKKDGQHNSGGNVDFDRALRTRNPEFGIRDIAELTDYAASNGLRLSDEIGMPANNRTLVFQRC